MHRSLASTESTLHHGRTWVCLFAAALLVSCSSGDGGDGGDGGGSSGPPAICTSYLACSAKLTPDMLPLLEKQFGPDGDCWTSADSAAKCTAGCVAFFDSLPKLPTLPPECTNTPPAPDAGVSIPEGGPPPDLYVPPPQGCEAVLGKPCTTGGAECAAGGSSTTCLMTNASKGVCSCSCTRDNPQTTVNEDSCPNLAQHACGEITLTNGTSQFYCLRTCSPKLGSNDCSGSLSCDPRSGASVGLFGQAVCLYDGCRNNTDCPVVTSKACKTTGSSPCPSGETCLPLAVGGTDGLCARAGVCDVASGICAPRTSNFKASAKVGDPCQDDTSCGANMQCERPSASGAGAVHARNGYCYVPFCEFPSLSQYACPAGSVCNRLFTGGLCQKSCSLGTAADCRGYAGDKFGDYECRDWSRVAFGAAAAAVAPTCDFGDSFSCNSFSSLTCADWGNSTNSTHMSCRSSLNVKLSNPKDASGFCLDDTASGPVN